MNNYNELNNFLSNLKVNKKKNNFDYKTPKKPEFSIENKKTKEKSLQERQEMNSRLFERSFNSVIPPNFSETNQTYTKKTNNSEFINKKIFDRHLLFTDSNTNKVFDQHPEMTRSIDPENKNNNK
jgi:hypothetical protein